MSYKAHTMMGTALAVGLLGLTGPASAEMVLSYQRTAAGTTGSGAGTSYSNTTTTSDTYGNSATKDSLVFGHPTTPFYTDPNTNISYGFYDDFKFTIGEDVVDSVTSSINLGMSSAISNLQVRLYNADLQTAPLPILGPPVGGAIDAWSTAINVAPGVTGTVDVLQPTRLSAGTYVLEVRGNVTGSGGGSYSGTLNLTPVPLPAALPLLLSGIGLLGGAARRSAKSIPA